MRAVSRVASTHEEQRAEASEDSHYECGNVDEVAIGAVGQEDEAVGHEGQTGTEEEPGSQ